MEIVICEDELTELDMVYKKLRTILGRFAIETGIARFSSGKELLTHVRNGRRFSLYILDILLEGSVNGIEVAREIRTADPDAQIAFLTNSREYAVDAFAVRAIHYLVKPVTEEGLLSVLERWHRETNKQEDYLEIQDGKELRKFPVSQILYVRSSDRGIEVHMKQHKWDAWMNSPFHKVEQAAETMPWFVRIARGCIVNMEFVGRIDYTDCTLVNGEVLAISRREHNRVMNSYNDFLFWKMEREGKMKEGELP